MERVQLISLLTDRDGAFEACRVAVERGASFDVFDGSLPASHFAEIYRGRQIHTRERGIPTVGFAEAVEVLYALRERPLRVGRVRLSDPPYYFQLFLSADESAVVACIGVDHQHQAQRAPQATPENLYGG